jgi:P22 coat protein - gene protein 5
LNQIVSPRWVTVDTAIAWKNNIKFVANLNREYDDEWRNKPKGAYIGATVQARLPERVIVSEGQALQVQPLLQQTAPITLNHQFQTAMEFSSFNQTVDIADVQQHHTIPSGRALANKADTIAAAEVYKSIFHTIGTPGSNITDDVTWTDGVAKLRSVGTPEELVGILTPTAQSKLTAANFALFGPRGQLDRNFRTGQFSGPALGVDEWYYDPNLPAHTTGNFTTSTPVTTSAGQTGSTLTISGMGTYTLNAGDTFKIAGVNEVNPLSYVDTGNLMEFTLKLTITGSSTATLTFDPPIITSGPLQTVTAAPANGAAILFTGATGTVAATMATTVSKQSFVINPKAFAFVMADLTEDLPGAEANRISDKDAKISMRRVAQYTITTDQIPRRIDFICGVAPVMQAFALRAWS